MFHFTSAQSIYQQAKACDVANYTTKVAQDRAALATFKLVHVWMMHELPQELDKTSQNWLVDVPVRTLFADFIESSRCARSRT